MIETVQWVMNSRVRTDNRRTDGCSGFSKMDAS